MIEALMVVVAVFRFGIIKLLSLSPSSSHFHTRRSQFDTRLYVCFMMFCSVVLIAKRYVDVCIVRLYLLFSNKLLVVRLHPHRYYIQRFLGIIIIIIISSLSFSSSAAAWEWQKPHVPCESTPPVRFTEELAKQNIFFVPRRFTSCRNSALTGCIRKPERRKINPTDGLEAAFSVNKAMSYLDL